MGKPGAFLHVERVAHDVADARESVAGYNEFAIPLSLSDQEVQASRCMDCGVAFCQCGIVIGKAKKPTGCPLHNPIPETNDLLYEGRLAEAAARLSTTNPFPEFTGRVCPAPCEQACNLGEHDQAVTIHDNERAISDAAWAAGVKPLPIPEEGAAKVAVVGSGPAGLAAAWKLACEGLAVTVFEKADRAGGLLMYGIPNMKLPKSIIERRIDLMQRSGVEFVFECDAIDRADEILNDFDAVVLACGFRKPRAMGVEGEDLENVRFAVDYLTEATKSLLDSEEPVETAQGKHVIVVGGGDTGVDCVATALRQGCASVHQVIRASAPKDPDPETDWMNWPNLHGPAIDGYGQLEAAAVMGEDPRVWFTDTLAFKASANGKDVAVAVLRAKDGSDPYEVPADLVLIAKGFIAPEDGILDAFHVACASEGKPVALVSNGTHRAILDQGSSFDTPVFAAGDFLTGSTLVASAMHDGIVCAEEVVAALGCMPKK